MGAVFEVEIISRDFIPPEVSAAYLQQFGAPFTIEKVECMQDWAWTGQRVLEADERDDIRSVLSAGQIVLLHGALGGVHAGRFQERNNDRTFQTHLWFEQSFYPMTGVASCVGSRAFFAELETKLETWLSVFSDYGPVLVVMGEEIAFQYTPDLDYLKEHCQVDRWIPFA